MTILFAMLAATAACGKESPDKQCEKIYQKGDGEKAYSTDKAKFIEACVKTGDNTRKCLLMKGKDRMKDDSCGPGVGNTFDEMASLMKLGQGTP
ncbi:MAG TPA: hypothetical protein VGF94_07030 [Kofleriaceae bacterium]